MNDSTLKEKMELRGLKLLKEVYERTRLRVGCFMLVSENR